MAVTQGAEDLWTRLEEQLSDELLFATTSTY